jgi:hypothetical protein
MIQSRLFISPVVVFDEAYQASAIFGNQDFAPCNGSGKGWAKHEAKLVLMSVSQSFEFVQISLDSLADHEIAHVAASPPP